MTISGGVGGPVKIAILHRSLCNQPKEIIFRVYLMAQFFHLHTQLNTLRDWTCRWKMETELSYWLRTSKYISVRTSESIQCLSTIIPGDLVWATEILSTLRLLGARAFRGRGARNKTKERKTDYDEILITSLIGSHLFSSLCETDPNWVCANNHPFPRVSRLVSPTHAFTVMKRNNNKRM